MTDSNGDYTITGITPGSYPVREEPQSGWTCSMPNPCRYDETFAPGDNKTGDDFGNYKPATLSGQKFEDKDADAQKDAGEPGLPGWTIYVDYNGDGDRDINDPFAVTDSNGDYTITGITPGSYSVREVPQSGWVCSMPTPCRYDETFSSGDNKTGRTFGNFRPASVSGTKVNDLNGNGTRDSGEPGLQGWRIYVDYDGNGSFDSGEPSAVTDLHGLYEITGVKPGARTLREVPQSGWVCSLPNPCRYQLSLSPGQRQTGRTFGNFRPASVSGTKFNDLNGNHKRDPGEPGLPGWRIYVDLNGGGSFQSNEPSGITDANGRYAIGGITPGTRTVREVLQAGWTCTFPSPCQYQQGFSSGESKTGRDFGNRRP